MKAGDSGLTPGQVYRRLLGYTRPHWKAFVIAMIGMAVYAAADTGFATLMKPLLDGTFVERDPFIIKFMPLAVLVLFLVRSAASFTSNYGMAYVGRRVIRAMRSLKAGPQLGSSGERPWNMAKRVWPRVERASMPPPP